MRKYIVGIAIGALCTISSQVWAQSVQTPDDLAHTLNFIIAIFDEERAELQAKLDACEARITNNDMSEPVLGGVAPSVEVEHSYDGTNLTFNVLTDAEKVKVDLWSPAGHNIGSGMNPPDVQGGRMGKFHVLNNMPKGSYQWEVTTLSGGEEFRESGAFEVN